MHQCIKMFFLFWNNAACFGRSFHPPPGVHNYTYTNRHMSNRYCYCLLAGTRWNYYVVLYEVYSESKWLASDLSPKLPWSQWCLQNYLEASDLSPKLSCNQWHVTKTTVKPVTCHQNYSEASDMSPKLPWRQWHVTKTTLKPVTCQRTSSLESSSQASVQGFCLQLTTVCCTCSWNQTRYANACLVDRDFLQLRCPTFLSQRFHTHYCKPVHRLPCEKITVSGIPNRLYYFVIFTVYTSFTNMAKGRIIQTGRLWVGDQCYTVWKKSTNIVEQHTGVLISPEPELIILTWKLII